MPSLVTAHYSPYSFMNSKVKGFDAWGFGSLILDYDCMVVPWMMDADQPEGDYMPYGTSNGGAAYLNCAAVRKGTRKRRLSAIGLLGTTSGKGCLF